jgi:hypothetical protein
MKKPLKKTRSRNSLLYIIIIGFLFIYLTIVFFKSFSTSLFVQKKDRVQILMYGQNAGFYSLGIQDPRNYVLYYPADLKVQLPGGYGSYRIGSIGKLVSLDKKPELYQKTFSLVTSSFVDFYFYPSNVEVFDGEEEQKEITKPTASDIFFMNSNAGFWDKVYLIMFLSNKNKDDFRLLKYKEVYEVKGDLFFMQDEFAKKNIGLFYQKIYRQEKKNVQILYTTHYRAADRISQMLEGGGIRVSDISLNINPTQTKTCIVKESSSDFTYTARSIASFFHCDLKEGKTDVYDIILELGGKEKEWEVSSDKLQQ